MKIEFFLPFPPSVNTEYNIRRVKDKKTGKIKIVRSKSLKVKKWIESCKKAIDQQMIFQQMNERCVVIYELNHPDLRKRDAANYEKYTTDFLVQAGILREDNRQHIKGIYSFWNDTKGDAVKVTIVPINDFKVSY